MKACAARRTSRAPRGRKSGTSRPLPKLSAASASRRIGRIWLRRNRTATVSSTSEVPTIQTRKMCELDDIGGAARREHAHHRIVELDADLDQRRAADRVDPERPADLLARAPPTAPGRAARRTASAPAAAVRSPAGSRRPGRACPARCGAAARGRGPADRPCRPRSRWRCPAPPPADSRCVTRFQCRSMNTKATTDCRITIGAMMISSARA